MNNNSPLFIVIEALDGAGKSTIGKKLCLKLGAELITSPDKALESIRKKADDSSDGFMQQLFYVAGVLHNSIKAEKMLREGKSIVMDRYWPSTIVYGSVTRDSGIEEEFWMQNFLDSIKVPDYTVYLKADADTRKKRMKERRGDVYTDGATDEASIDYAEELSQKYDEIFGKYQARTGKLIEVSNSEVSIDDCVGKIMQEILSSRSSTS